MRAPTRAIAVPSTTGFVGGSRKNSHAPSPTKIGCVVTSTTLAVMEVRSSDATHTPKCRASTAPESKSDSQWRRGRPRRSPIPEVAAAPTMTGAEKRRRSAAIASAGAPASSARRISGAAHATANTPSARTATARRLNCGSLNCGSMVSPGLWCHGAALLVTPGYLFRRRI